MTRSRWAAVSVLVAVLGAVMAPATAAAPIGRGRPDAVPTARVGAASRSVLPLVGGARDYLRAGLPSERTRSHPGCSSGSGTTAASRSATATASRIGSTTTCACAPWRSPTSAAGTSPCCRRGPLHDLPRRRRPDSEEGGGAAAGRAAGRAGRHVHAQPPRPDTAFDVNHAWYEEMTDQAADAVVEPSPAAAGALRVGSGKHWFGMDDGDPQVIDPSMNVLQAVGTNGKRDRDRRAVEQPPRDDAGLGTAGRPERGVRGAGLAGRRVPRGGPLLHERLRRRAVAHDRGAHGGEALYFVGALGHWSAPAGPTSGRSTAGIRWATSSTRHPGRPSRAATASPTPTRTSGARW